MKTSPHRKPRSSALGCVTGTALLTIVAAMAHSNAASAQEIPRTDRRVSEVRHLDLTYAMPVYASKADWLRRAERLRHQILASAGLSPMPPRPEIKAQVFGRVDRGDYTIEKVYFESYPGFYVTGNLYRPKNPPGRVPAVLCPHGHWTYGRLENTSTASIPMRAANFARLGMVAFSYDMVGYDDSSAISHRFAPGHREGFDAAALWSANLLGLQLWNSIRSLDFLLTLPEVDPDRIGSTGASGGATQTFLHAAIDDRVKVTAPVNMISSIMQGGSLCENAPNLRVDTNNMELGSLTAPRPMLMVSATGDWTKNTLTVEYPAVRSIYRLFGAETDLHAIQINAPHNYNQESREAVYGWFAHYLLGRPEKTPIKERSTGVASLPELLVFFGRSRPEGELNEAGLLDSLISRARSQFAELQPVDAASLERFRSTYGENLRNSLMAENPNPDDILVERSGITPSAAPPGTAFERIVLSRRGQGDRVEGKLWSPSGVVGPQGVVLVVTTKDRFGDLGEPSRNLIDRLARRGRAVFVVRAFSSAGRPKNDFKFLTTYNRSDDANRVQDVLSSIAFLRQRFRNAYLSVLGDGTAGLWTLLARGIAPRIDRMAIDVNGFDNTSDEAFVSSLPIPGVRRAGDFLTAVLVAPFEPLLIYNTQGRFATDQLVAAFAKFGRRSDLTVSNAMILTEGLSDWLVQE